MSLLTPESPDVWPLTPEFEAMLSRLDPMALRIVHLAVKRVVALEDAGFGEDADDLLDGLLSIVKADND